MRLGSAQLVAILAHVHLVNLFHVLNQIVTHRVFHPAHGATFRLAVNALFQIHAVRFFDVIQERLPQRVLGPADFTLVRILQLVALHVALELGRAGRDEPANLANEGDALRRRRKNRDGRVCRGRRCCGRRFDRRRFR